MSYDIIKARIEQASRRLESQAPKELKQSLIRLQGDVAKADLSVQQRNELRNVIQALFDKIKVIQAQKQKEFEKESQENFALLKEKVVEAINFTEQNIEKHDMVWHKLVDVQHLFKGRKLEQGKRDQLYNTLQKLFEIVKNRRDQSRSEHEKLNSEGFKSPDEEVEYYFKLCSTGDIDQLWSQMLQLKDKVSRIDSTLPQRKRLSDKIQDGFAILKARREDRQSELSKEGKQNAEYLKDQLTQATLQLDSDNDFKEKWEFLLGIQQEFRSRKLEKETRNTLYDELQALFLKVKTMHFADHAEFEKQADQNYQLLSAQVDQGFELARTSSDLKKTKALLIRIQADFKGRKMRTQERERIYAKLQLAFDILNKRIDESADAPAQSVIDD